MIQLKTHTKKSHHTTVLWCVCTPTCVHAYHGTRRARHRRNSRSSAVSTHIPVGLNFVSCLGFQLPFSRPCSSAPALTLPPYSSALSANVPSPKLMLILLLSAVALKESLPDPWGSPFFQMKWSHAQAGCCAGCRPSECKERQPTAWGNKELSLLRVVTR